MTTTTTGLFTQTEPNSNATLTQHQNKNKILFCVRSHGSHLDEDGEDEGFGRQRAIGSVAGARRMGLDHGAVLVVVVATGQDGCRGEDEGCGGGRRGQGGGLEGVSSSSSCAPLHGGLLEEVRLLLVEPPTWVGLVQPSWTRTETQAAFQFVPLCPIQPTVYRVTIS